MYEVILCYSTTLQKHTEESYSMCEEILSRLLLTKTGTVSQFHKWCLELLIEILSFNVLN